jgi:N-acetylglutamate synthase-like GNAT family acetyltransferase
MIATVLDAGSVPALAVELGAAGLPISDLTEPGRQFYRFDDDAGLVGYGGIEGLGADRLLRSLVVTPARRGSGGGAAMLAAIERAAADSGAVCLYLLTTTAEPYFRRHGYGLTDRAHAPDAISGSIEFRSLCPASAAFLSKRIA